MNPREIYDVGAIVTGGRLHHDELRGLSWTPTAFGALVRLAVRQYGKPQFSDFRRLSEDCRRRKKRRRGLHHSVSCSRRRWPRHLMRWASRGRDAWPWRWERPCPEGSDECEAKDAKTHRCQRQQHSVDDDSCRRQTTHPVGGSPATRRALTAITKPTRAVRMPRPHNVTSGMLTIPMMSAVTARP